MITKMKTPHPELGDEVYHNGELVGTIGFFYNRLSQNEYGVQIEGHEENDPAVVSVIPVGEDEWTLELRTGATHVAWKPDVKIEIQNNTEEV